MDELLIGLQSSDSIKLFLDIILNRLNIMVGGLLYGHYPCGGFLVEETIDVAKSVELVVWESGELRQRQLNESDEILDFNTHAIFY